MNISEIKEQTDSCVSVWKALSLLASVSTLTACSFMDPVEVEEDFGQSVRQMVQEQIYDTQTAHQPALNAPDVLDGVSGAYAIDGYRANAKTSRDNKPTPETGRLLLPPPPE